MLQAIGIGLITALFVSLPQILKTHFESAWMVLPSGILVAGVGAAISQKWVLDRRLRDAQYHGLADLLIYVHKPVAQGSPLSWAIRGLVSFFLVMAGGVAGFEGAAIEWMQALQMRLDSFSVKWFEQKRRTHVASILAAGIAAAFGAPFAGLLLTFELGVGGRSLTAALSALTAYLASRALAYQFSLHQIGLHGVLPQFNFLDWKDWVGILLVGVAGGGVGAIAIFLARYTQDSLASLLKSRIWMRLFIAGVLLFLVRSASQSVALSPEVLMEHALWSKLSLAQLGLIGLSQLMILFLLVGGFGTIGWIWPALALGATMGCATFQLMPQEVFNLTPIAGLAGAVTLWAVLLNAPLSGAILALELTKDFQFVLPIWAIAWLGIRVRDLFRVRPLLEYDLMVRGHALHLGRSMNVMNSISVQSAMATDYAWVYADDTQAQVLQKASQSPYPFLPVIQSDGKFLGMLTTDLILFESSAENQLGGSQTQLVEAKDLVYRFGIKPPVIQPADRLKSVVHWLDEFPCLPVVGADEKLVGLLLGSQVRLAYEREVGRRTFDFVPKEKNE